MKKNILFLFADQLRADFLGCYGADWLKTPNLDTLAAEGVLYSKAATPSPACVPARCSLLTGRNAIRNRVLDNVHWLRPDHDAMGDHTWAKLLSDEGFQTAAIGKMHFYPWDISEGFQKRIIAEDKRHVEIEDDYALFCRSKGYNRYHGSHFDGYYEHKGAYVNTLPDELQIDRYVCDRSCEYLEGLDPSRPFALMVGFPGPHCPYDPTEEMLDRLGDGTPPKARPGTKDTEIFRLENVASNKRPWNGVDLSEFTDEQIERVRRHYSALVEAIDSYAGKIITKLKEGGLYEDTIILFSSDHGDYLGDFGMAGKGHFYESAYHIPLIVRHPEKGKGLTIDSTVSLTDVHHTILKFAGIAAEETDDSAVLAPFSSTGGRKSPVFGCNNMNWMLKDDRYILTMYYNGLREFYDLREDRDQQHNLIDHPDHQERIREMGAELQRRVFASLQDSTRDNLVRPGWTPPGFHSANWERPYPLPLEVERPDTPVSSQG